jgi:hypothetical protein
MTKAILTLLFCATSAFGQDAFVVSLGGRLPFSSTYSNLDHFHEDYWPIGVNARLAYDLEVSRWLRILSGLEYTLYPLSSKPVFPRGYSAIYGPPSGSGEGFHRLLVNIECRVHWPSGPNIFRPFVQIDGAYLLERIGQITFVFPPTMMEVIDERLDRHAWAFGFGVGSELWISQHLRVEPSLQYLSSIDEHMYGLLAVDLVYVFRL